MQAVSTMSTRQATAARNTSNDVSVTAAITAAKRIPRRRAKNPKPAAIMATAASADGSRDVNSFTTPPLSSNEKPAMSHARKGGL